MIVDVEGSAGAPVPNHGRLHIKRHSIPRGGRRAVTVRLALFALVALALASTALAIAGSRGDGGAPGAGREPDEPPTAVDDTRLLSEDEAPKQMHVKANDLNADGGPFDVTSFTDPANGTVARVSGGNQLTYEPDDDYCNRPPGTTPDTFDYTLTGGSTATVTINVKCVDDLPTAVDDTRRRIEDDAAMRIGVKHNDIDPDGGPSDVTSFTDPANGTVAREVPGGNRLTYEPDDNYCNRPPGTTPDTFDYTLTGGSTATVTMNVTCVNDAPVADDETFNGNDSAHGNTTLQVDDPDDDKSAPTNPHTEISGDILAGDSDVDGPGPLTITPGTFPTNDPGGSVTIESDGDFVYQPSATTSCTDTSDFFDYTVSDGNTPTAGTDTGRVTIAIAGCVWYVSNNGTGNSGTSVAPFDTLAQAETASGTNHTVFVYDGDNTSTGYDAGGYLMNSGERLIGEHEGLVVDPDQGGGLTADNLHPANPGAHPTLTANNADVIDLDDGNELRGLNVDPQGTGGGIFGGAGDSSGTFDDLNIVDNGTAGSNPGLELSGTSGTWNASNLVVQTAGGATGVQLNNAGTANFAPAGQISISSNGGAALAATSTNMGTSTFDDLTSTNSNAGGVTLISTPGTTTLGDGTGTDLDLTTTSGLTPALQIVNGGTVSADAAGSDDLRATGAPAIDVQNTAGATFDLDDVDSTNSVSDGINLDGLGTGTFSAATGDIGGADGISFDLNGGSGAITYPGDLDNGDGTTAIDITGRSGGAVSLSGPISDTSDAGGGINLGSNTGGSTTISNATKQLNTGASDGLIFNNSDGHTLNVTNGGLDIDTTSGKGLEAATSGTIEVSGTGNTIDATALGASNRGLNISDTDVADADVTFQRISTSGGINGIRVNNSTNANGRLFLTSSGSGTCDGSAGCTGGFVQNATQTGVVLNNLAGGAEFMRLGVQDSADHGIDATSVSNGILLDRAFINSNGNAVADNGLDYSNVTGITAIRHSDVIGSGVANDGGWNALITNSLSTALHLTVNDNDFNAASTEDGLQLGASGSGVIRSNITGNRFDNNKGDAFQIADAVSTTVTSDHTFTGNTIDGTAGTATDGGIVISTDGSSRVNASNNTITGVSVSGIILNPLGSAGGTVADMTASNNDIGTAGVQQSGSADGDGMQLKSASDGTSKIVMTNNDIFGWQGAGMRMRASETTTNASTHLTAQANTIGDEENDGAGGVAADAGIWLQAGSGAADILNMCANVGGAGALANTLTSPPVNNDAIADFVLDLRFANSTMRVPNYTGTTVTDRQNYFLGRNTGFTNFAQDGLQNMSNEADGACDQPNSPTLPTAPPAVGP